MSSIEQKILSYILVETNFSGLDFYPCGIDDIQKNIDADEMSIISAINKLFENEVLEFRGIGNSMVQLTIKGKLLALKL